MSETKNLKLKKHDNPETNTEKFDIENYLNGNWDKIDENVGEVNTNISNIKKEQETQNTNIEENNSKIVELQTEKAKLETELKEMQEDFYQNSIRGQASGEYIHVEDSSNCRAKIGIGGNSEQETSTQGKNYFTGNKIPGGINFSVNYSFDNSILKLNGTATKGGNVILDKPTKVKIPAGTYTYTIKVKSGTFEIPRGDFAVYIMSGSNTFIAGNYSNSGITGSELRQKKGIVSHIFNLTEEKEIYLRCYTSNSNIVFNNLELEIQIESGSVYTEFEQFVPNMPSPDYPSQVKAVGDNVNWFDVTQMKQTIPVGTSDFIYLTKKPNTKYTLSTSLPLADNNTADIFLISGHTTVGTTTDNGVWKENSRTITSDRNGYLTIAYRKQNVSSWTNLTSYKYKLVEGTEVGEYSSYGQGCVKVTKCNKNLINKNLLTNYQILEDTGKLLSNNTRLITPFIYLKKGTYSLSCNLSRFAYAIYNIDKSFNCFVTWKAFPNQIVLNSDCYIKIEFIINPTGSEQVSIKDITYLQLEKGNTTDYEEHEEQSYIMPVQKEMLEDDYFDWDNEEVHTWNKLVLNGTEEFNSWTGNAPSGYKVFYLKSLTNAINPQGDLKCNTFKYMENPWESGKNAIGLQRVFKEVYISIESKYASTLEEFKAYLKSQYDAGTPVVVYYKLATPTRLKFTDEQKSVAKELNNARTYKNVTNITTDSKAILSLDYAKDQETQNQKMQNEIDEIKQLLSTTQTSALLLDNLQKEVESEVE